ncbi:MAG: hypothetical protein CML13_01785 [Puniceicoccaceae bacterium]|nr:hypothetical protein [Puniceicoccaceae bacterium]|tara:strand:+ start:120 stop:869 length:750 start_codon:yes stop_codon:yes gene_type:complete
MKQTTLLITTSLALTSSAFAATLIGEDFESYTGGTPSGWLKVEDSVFSAGAGLNGSSTSLQLGITSNGNNNSALRNNFSSSGAITSTFSLQFDFMQLSTGNDPSNGTRQMNFTLRDDSGSVINWRVLWDGVNDGTLQYFDGAWQNMSTQNELINQSDTYRVLLTGDITDSYSISVTNLTDSTIVGGQSGISDYQSSFTDLTELRFERGRSTADYLVDNVLLTNVPEPQSFAALLGLGALLAVATRRRHS